MASLRDILPAPRNASSRSSAEFAGEEESLSRLAPATDVVAASASRGSGATSLLPLSIGPDGQPDFSNIARAGENQTRVVHADHSALVEKSRDTSLQRQLVRPDAEAVATTAKLTRDALDPIVRGKVTASLPSSFRGREGGARRTAEFVRYTPASTNFGGSSKQRIIKMVQAPVDPMEPARFSLKKTPAAPPSPPVPVLHSPTRNLTKEEAADWIVPPAISNWKNNRGYTVPLDKRLASDATGLRDTCVSDKFAALAETMYTAERTAREEVEKRAQIQRTVSLKAKETKEKQLRELAARAREERAGFVSNRVDSGSQSHVVESAPFLSSSAEHGSDPVAVGVPIEESPPQMTIGGFVSLGKTDSAGLSADAPYSDRAPPRRSRNSRFGIRDHISVHGSVVNLACEVANTDDVARRDAIREEARQRREREMRLRGRHEEADANFPTLKRSKLSRDQDRDLAERIALGQRPGDGPGAKEVMYDQRLFNEGGRARGMAAGFGGEDADSLYDKPLFEGGQSSKFQYHPKPVATSLGYGDKMGQEGVGTARFKPDRALGGADGVGTGDGRWSDGPRTRPVEFERDEATGELALASAADPFGLDDMLGKISKK
jgi:SNW domain-containing protein 1